MMNVNEKQDAVYQAVVESIETWSDTLVGEIESEVESRIQDSLSSYSQEIAQEVAEEIKRWIQRDTKRTSELHENVVFAINEAVSNHPEQQAGIVYSPSTWSPELPAVTSVSELIDMVSFAIEKNVDIYTMVQRITDLRNAIARLKETNKG